MLKVVLRGAGSELGNRNFKSEFILDLVIHQGYPRVALHPGFSQSLSLSIPDLKIHQRCSKVPEYKLKEKFQKRRVLLKIVTSSTHGRWVLILEIHCGCSEVALQEWSEVSSRKNLVEKFLKLENRLEICACGLSRSLSPSKVVLRRCTGLSWRVNFENSEITWRSSLRVFHGHCIHPRTPNSLEMLEGGFVERKIWKTKKRLEIVARGI